MKNTLNMYYFYNHKTKLKISGYYTRPYIYIYILKTLKNIYVKI